MQITVHHGLEKSQLMIPAAPTMTGSPNIVVDLVVASSWRSPWKLATMHCDCICIYIMSSFMILISNIMIGPLYILFAPTTVIELVVGRMIVTLKQRLILGVALEVSPARLRGHSITVIYLPYDGRGID